MCIGVYGRRTRNRSSLRRLEEAIEDGYADFDRGDYMDAAEFAATLVDMPSKNP